MSRVYYLLLPAVMLVAACNPANDDRSQTETLPADEGVAGTGITGGRVIRK